MAALGPRTGLYKVIGQPLPWNVRLYWPNLKNDNHSITSPATDNYNCIAWAYGVNNKWMWPGDPDSYWPSQATDKDELQNLIQLYIDAGYEKCDNCEQEEGFKKVAIYVDQEGPTHAALQLDSGRWTSKLGRLQDIEHDTPEALEGGKYGKATVFLRKRV